jgi:serine protease Do
MLKRARWALGLVLLGALLGAFSVDRWRAAPGSAAFTRAPSGPPASPTRDGASQRPAVTAASGAPQPLPDLTAVAARAVASVVNISAVQVVRTPLAPFATDPLFRYFFGDEDLFAWRERPSLGSGVIVSPDGYVLTNQHVVGQRTADVTITLADRRERKARLVGQDDWTDIALLKIDGRNLPVLPWGDSSKLKVAEWVLAIGNPYQLSSTVTVGIVSAVGRTNLGITTYEDFIQTDAAINPGNSGGALINARGELVGINTAIFTQTGGYQGIGFAVPSNLARRVMEDLIKYGEVRRGSLGYLRVTSLTPELAEELGAPTARGAVVTEMRRDSEAFRAGLRPGDLIVEFDGHPVEDAAHLLRLLADARIGSSVRLRVWRNGGFLDVTATVRRAPSRRSA